MSDKPTNQDATENLGRASQPPDLERMVRDAIRQNGIDTKGAVPLIQPRTLPLIQPQPLPTVPTVAARSDAAPPGESAPEAIVAEPAAPARAKRRTRTSTLVLSLMAVVAIACGGAAWLTRSRGVVLVRSSAAAQNAAAQAGATQKNAAAQKTGAAQTGAAQGN